MFLDVTAVCLHCVLYFPQAELRIDKTRLYNFSRVKKDRRWLKVSLCFAHQRIADLVSKQTVL